MCSNLQYLGGYPPRVAPCLVCRECKTRRLMDIVGRCIAESQYAVATSFATLTYGGGDENHAASMFTYRHVQLYLKQVRRAGYPLRYYAVGEYGTERGRDSLACNSLVAEG